MAAKKEHFIEMILKRSADTPEIPLAFISSPGMGKSQIVEDYARSNKLPLVKLLTSTLNEDDIAGIVVSTAVKVLKQDDDGNVCMVPSVDGSAKTLSPSWLKVLENGGILFMDELNAGRKEVQDTLLTLIQSRHMPNGDKLHPHVRIIACMNDYVQCNNYCMSPAMRNRFAWFQVKPNISQWLSWLKSKVHAEVYAFMTAAFKRGMQFSDDKAFMKDEENLFTTPRSLFNLITFCGGCDKNADGLKIVQEIVGFSKNFVDVAAQGVMKTLGAEAKKDRSNAVFMEYIADKSIDGTAMQNITNVVIVDSDDED
jgi:MoxR-like ATPase